MRVLYYMNCDYRLRYNTHAVSFSFWFWLIWSLGKNRCQARSRLSPWPREPTFHWQELAWSWEQPKEFNFHTHAPEATFLPTQRDSAKQKRPYDTSRLGVEFINTNYLITPNRDGGILAQVKNLKYNTSILPFLSVNHPHLPRHQL